MKNGKINIKQIIILAVVILFIGYELLFGGNEGGEEIPVGKVVQSEEQSHVAESLEMIQSSVPSLAEYLSFRNDSLWESHYEKHGIDMGFDSMEEYLEAANLVLYNENTLHKIEAEDGDDVYFLEETGEFVVVSGDGYIRTYFIPDDGIDYFNRQ